MGKSKIEWTDETWNPVRGCTKISPGCKNCYAATFAERFRGVVGHPYEQGFDLRLVHNKLTEPLTWRKSRTVFVNSMSDLFHQDIPDEYIDQVFAVMMACGMLENRRHRFQVLTKRSDRMLSYLTDRSPVELLQAWAKAGNGLITMDDEDTLFSEMVTSETCHDWDENGRNSSGSDYKPWGYLKKLWPLPNVWLGVSVENQKAADERIPNLIKTPAAIRFLSMEPLLENVEIFRFDEEEQALRGVGVVRSGGMTPSTPDSPPEGCDDSYPGIDWVIIGGESGRGARECNLDWIHSITEQCSAAEVPVFVKQLGAKPVYPDAVTKQIVPFPISDAKGAQIGDFPCHFGREFPEVANARI